MRIEACAVAAALLFSAHAHADAPATAPTSPAKTDVPEPHVQRTVIEDDLNRVEELNVRGQARSVTVTTKGALPGTYEIHMGDPSRDISDGAGVRGAVGQRMWRVLSF